MRVSEKKLAGAYDGKKAEKQNGRKKPARMDGKRSSQAVESRIVVPQFSTEAEEAEWWYRNRHMHAQQLLTAVRKGKAQILTKGKLIERIEATKAKLAAQVISLRVSEADLAMARRQAEKKGLPYQTYIKSLLHETLTAREKRRSKSA
jgi:predicted DNA binding CopG/RHH family protein